MTYITTTDIQNDISGLLNLDISTDSAGKVLEITNDINSILPQIRATSQFQEKISQTTSDNLTKQNKALEDENNNKRRMIEINNYYSNMNTYINIIMKNVVILLVIIIFFTILSKKGLLPTNISNLINSTCIIIIIIYVIYSIYDINIRDKFNFNEYQIPFDIEAIHLENSGNLINLGKELEDELISGIRDIGNYGTCLGKSVANQYNI